MASLVLAQDLDDGGSANASNNASNNASSHDANANTSSGDSANASNTTATTDTGTSTAAGTSTATESTSTETSTATSGPPMSMEPSVVFCEYNCSAADPRSRPPPLGRCLYTSEVYRTGDGWLTLIVRDNSTGVPTYDPSWIQFSAGNMTWEAWFRIVELPSDGAALLMGTYGSNHDTDDYYRDIITYSLDTADVEGTARRRYAAVWVDSKGQVYMETNVGTSSGAVYGPGNISLADGKWHHVAAMWSTTGGKQLTMSVSAHEVNWNNVATAKDWSKLASFEETIRATVVGFLGRWGVVSEGVHVHTQQDISDPTNRYRVLITFTVNCPAENFDEIKESLAGKRAVSNTFTAVLNTLDWIKPLGFLGDIHVPVENMIYPVETDVGSAALFVDGIQGSGSIVYALPLHVTGTEFITDSIATEGRLQVCGGKLGEVLPCEVSRFRLWDMVLTQSQLFQVQQCALPSLKNVIGGGWPFGLRASWELNGDYNNSAEVHLFPNLQDDYSGRFVRSNLCGYDRCPSTSEGGCPLKRQMHFDVADTCEEFASFSSCRATSFSRGMVSHPFRAGCHAGSRR